MSWARHAATRGHAPRPRLETPRPATPPSLTAIDTPRAGDREHGLGHEMGRKRWPRPAAQRMAAQLRPRVMLPRFMSSRAAARRKLAAVSCSGLLGCTLRTWTENYDERPDHTDGGADEVPTIGSDALNSAEPDERSRDIEPPIRSVRASGIRRFHTCKAPGKENQTQNAGRYEPGGTTLTKPRPEREAASDLEECGSGKETERLQVLPPSLFVQPNGVGAQLRATAPPWLDRSAQVSTPDSTTSRLKGAVARQLQRLVGRPAISW
jgi:hypothetical protein